MIIRKKITIFWPPPIQWTFPFIYSYRLMASIREPPFYHLPFQFQPASSPHSEIFQVSAAGLESATNKPPPSEHSTSGHHGTSGASTSYPSYTGGLGYPSGPKGPPEVHPNSPYPSYPGAGVPKGGYGYPSGPKGTSGAPGSSPYPSYPRISTGGLGYPSGPKDAPKNPGTSSYPPYPGGSTATGYPSGGKGTQGAPPSEYPGAK